MLDGDEPSKFPIIGYPEGPGGRGSRLRREIVITRDKTITASAPETSGVSIGVADMKPQHSFLHVLL